MMRKYAAQTVLRAFAALAIAGAALLSPIASPAPAEAAPLAGKQRPAAAPSGDYLDRLLGEINARRATIGSPPLAYATPRANQAVGQYLADLTPLMWAMHSCFHGMYNPVAPGWDYVKDAGLGGEPRGEVIGCPGEGFYWSPQQIADGWWGSPAHFEALYRDAHANVVACGTYGPGRGGFETVACITYRL